MVTNMQLSKPLSNGIVVNQIRLLQNNKFAMPLNAKLFEP